MAQRVIVEKEWAAIWQYVAEQSVVWRERFYEIFNRYSAWPHVNILSSNQWAMLPEGRSGQDWTAVRAFMRIHKEVLMRDYGLHGALGTNVENSTERISGYKPGRRRRQFPTVRIE